MIGDSIYTNPLLLGYAWQKGWLPLAYETMVRAIEINGIAVDKTKTHGSAYDAELTASLLHKLRVADPDVFEQMLMSLSNAIADRYFLQGSNAAPTKKLGGLA